MKSMLIEPVDTVFLRDGTPFASGSASQDEVGGLFPPHPVTVAGAIRAALARRKGWDGVGRWPRELDEVLGNGPDDLGGLVLEGPFLVRSGGPLFPVPRHVLGSVEDGTWRPRGLLRPGSAVSCDLGDDVRLPEFPRADLPVEDVDPGDGFWLTGAGMEAVLRGELPPEDQVVSTGDLWSEERRTGIERDRNTRTAREGMLYSTRHVRLAEGVALGLRLGGLPPGWELPSGEIIVLGGEMRMAECRPWAWDVKPGFGMPPPTTQTGGRMTIIALTPLDLDVEVCRGTRPLPSSGDPRIVSACLGRPQRIGGWDSLARRPLPLRGVLPAGSVLFCEVGDPESFLDGVGANGGLPRLGARTECGFGTVAVGRWPDGTEVTS